MRAFRKGRDMLALLLAASTLALPGAQPPVFMDYLATEGATVWVPGANTGKVFVLEAGKVRPGGSFSPRKGRKDRRPGANSAAIGRGVPYHRQQAGPQGCAGGPPS